MKSHNNSLINIPNKEPENISMEDCVQIEIPYNLLQYLSSNDFNIQALCRICMSANNTELFPLHFTNEKELLSEMFMFTTMISISPDDGLPSKVCESCRFQLINCYEFKTNCVKSDGTLKSILKGDFGSKAEEREEQVDSLIISDKEIFIDKDPSSNFEIVKVEPDEVLNEDVQYLEDINDADSEDETLCIVQNASNEHTKEYQDNFTDTNNTIVDEVLQKPKKNKENTVLKKATTSKPNILSKYKVCTICSKRFNNLKALESHTKQMHSTEEQPHSCQHCKATFYSAYDLRLHSIEHDTGPVWRCSECKKEFLEKFRLRRHVQRHMKSKRYACVECGKSFMELYALKRHGRVHTGERAEKRHACNLCDKRYSEYSLLEAHLARHRGERPCVCATCGKAFSSARLLASHRLVHSDDKPHLCRYCGKGFRHESTRNTHHRTHTGEKPYVCAACGKTFIQNSNLTLHMRTHTGERPYECETCGRRFSSGSTLKTHRRAHTGEKPFACTVCDKRFARMDMSAHMRAHMGERPYACGVCARTFTRQARLLEHCRIHTGEKPFECTMCSQKFAIKSRLVKHIKEHKSAKKAEQEVLIVRKVTDDKPYIIPDQFYISKVNETITADDNIITDEFNENGHNMVSEEALEITEELILQDDEIKTDLLVVEETQNTNYENETLCLSSSGVNFVKNEVNYSDVNLVTVNEGEVSISSSSAVVDGTTVKLYQVDQSLVQIHSVAGQVTISKITSKMTANF